jgi:hypothetical protein
MARTLKVLVVMLVATLLLASPAFADAIDAGSIIPRGED